MGLPPGGLLAFVSMLSPEVDFWPKRGGGLGGFGWLWNEGVVGICGFDVCWVW